MNCSCCNRHIKHPYHWDGKVYGKQCWIKHCLPELEAIRAQQDDERLQKRIITSRIYQEVFKQKKVRGIKNEFKLKFIPSIINQVKKGRMLSNKQMDLCSRMFNDKDYRLYFTLRVQSGLDDPVTHLMNGQLTPDDLEITNEEAAKLVITYREIPATPEAIGSTINEHEWSL